LFETRAGLLISTSAPSVVTTYRQSIDMRDAVFISQSGRSPDLVIGARSARKSGALTIAIVNDVTSPVALACELTLPVGAGLEHAVAATKSVVLSMVISGQLVATLTSDHALREKIKQLPQRFGQALTCDWSAQSGSFAAARAAPSGSSTSNVRACTTAAREVLAPSATLSTVTVAIPPAPQFGGKRQTGRSRADDRMSVFEGRSGNFKLGISLLVPRFAPPCFFRALSEVATRRMVRSVPVRIKSLGHSSSRTSAIY
jgi:hypothetical protein